jgi:hypothetical protein
MILVTRNQRDCLIRVFSQSPPSLLQRLGAVFRFPWTGPGLPPKLASGLPYVPVVEGADLTRAN